MQHLEESDELTLSRKIELVNFEAVLLDEASRSDSSDKQTSGLAMQSSYTMLCAQPDMQQKQYA